MPEAPANLSVEGCVTAVCGDARITVFGDGSSACVAVSSIRVGLHLYRRTRGLVERLGPLAAAAGSMIELTVVLADRPVATVRLHGGKARFRLTPLRFFRDRIDVPDAPEAAESPSP